MTAILPDVYIMNLPREVKRRYVSIGTHLAQNVPFENLHTYKAIDDRDFETSNDLIRAAIDDGFPQFENYIDTEKAIARFGQMWNYCRFYRDVATQSKKTTLLIQDDRRLRADYPRMIKELSTTLNLEDFHFLSLWKSKNYLKENIEASLHDKRVAKGIVSSGACVCSFVSPKGAQWILDNAIGHIPVEYPHISVEWVLKSKCENQPGFYTLIGGEFMAINILADGWKNKLFLPGRVWRDGELLRKV